MERNILAIETATSICSVAILVNGEVLASMSSDVKRQHNEKFPSMVSGVLGECGLALSDVRTIAVSIGPGSFTGLRVGLGYAKGVALGNGGNIIPIGTLEGISSVMMNSHSEKLRESSYIIPLTTARRTGSFGQKFKVIHCADTTELLTDSEPFYFDFEKWEASIPHNSIIGGEGSERFYDFLDEEGRANFRWIENCKADAVEIGKLAHKLQIIDFKAPDSDSLEPTYLREFTVAKV